MSQSELAHIFNGLRGSPDDVRIEVNAVTIVAVSVVNWARGGELLNPVFHFDDQNRGPNLQCRRELP